MAFYLLDAIPARQLDDNANAQSGAKLYAFAAGTTTPLATYTDSTGAVQHSHPIVAAATGFWPEIWVSAAAYDLEARKADGTSVLWNRDNVQAPPALIADDLLDHTGDTTGAGMVGWSQDNDYADNTVGEALQQMLGTTVFQYYVATTGNDANPGTQAQPFKTLQRAFDELMALGTVGGTRRISVGAGTWFGSDAVARLGHVNMSRDIANGTAYLQDGGSQANFLYIEGPDVGYNPASNPWPTPTAIFEANGATSYSIQIESGWKVLIRNIKFVDFNGSASAYAISCEHGRLRLENVHTSGCNGASITHGSIEVQGGDFYGSAGKDYVGIRSISGSQHSIGSQSGPVGRGPRFRFLNQAILAQENSTGHCDYISVEDCNDGLRVISSSRFNHTGADFKRCVRAVRASENSNVFASPGSANFHFGTADACDNGVVLQTGSVEVSRDSGSNTVLASDYTSTMQTVTGTTTGVSVLTKTLAQGEWAPTVNSLRRPQHIELHAIGEIVGSADSKKFRLRLGATVLAEITAVAAATGFYVLEGGIYFTASNEQKAWLKVTIDNFTTPYLDVDNGSEDLAAGDLDLIFQVQLSNAADSVNSLAHFKTVG